MWSWPGSTEDWNHATPYTRSLGVTRCPPGSLGNGNVHSFVWLKPWLLMDSHECVGGLKEGNVKMAGSDKVSASTGPVAMLACSVLQALRGCRGNGIHLVLLWLPPTRSSLKKLCFVKASAPTFCFGPVFYHAPPLLSAISLPVPQQSARFIPSLCAHPLGCLTNVSASANTLEFE